GGDREAARECSGRHASLLRRSSRRPRSRLRLPPPASRLPAPGRSMTDRAREISEQVARITAENARLLDRLTETEKRFRCISRGVLRVQEEERGKISRDLHDGIGQSLTALKIQLELLEQEAGKAQQALAPRIGAARELAETCLAEVR